MTTITTTEEYIDGIGYMIDDYGDLVANFDDTINSITIRKADSDETELTERDIMIAKRARKDAAYTEAENALESDGGYDWILQDVNAGMIDWTDEQIEASIRQKADEVFETLCQMDSPVQYLDFNEFYTASDARHVVELMQDKINTLRAQRELDKIMTAAEAVEEFGLSESAVRQAINRKTIPARKSGETWLILREDAEERWSKK